LVILINNNHLLIERFKMKKHFSKIFLAILIIFISSFSYVSAQPVELIGSISMTPTSHTVCAPLSGTVTATYTISVTRANPGDLTAHWAFTSFSAGVTASFSPLSFTSLGSSDIPSTVLTFNVPFFSSGVNNQFTVALVNELNSEYVAKVDGSIEINTAPTLEPCHNIFDENDPGICGASKSFSSFATGTPTPVLTYSIGSPKTLITSPHTFPVGNTTVTCSATNSCGTTTCQFNVEIRDEENPVFTGCPSTVIAYTGPNATSCEAVATWTEPIATDNCGTPTVNSNYHPGNTFDGFSGATRVTYTARDAAGNLAECDFYVIVIDNTPPEFFNCPSNITVFTGNTPNNCNVKVSWSGPQVEDNCSYADVYSNHYPGDYFPLGSTTVTYNAEDDEGNSSECSFIVTVIDNSPPDIHDCPSDITVYTGPGATTCSATATWTAPKATDNCGAPTLTSNYASGSTFPVGTTTVIYTATDGSGNTSTCTFVVTVIDNTPPVITGVTNVPLILWPPNHKYWKICPNVLITDNCPNPTFTVISITSNEPQNGLGDGDTPIDWQILNNGCINLRAERSGTGTGRIYTITFMATDAHGNTSAPATITVKVPHDMGSRDGDYSIYTGVTEDFGILNIYPNPSEQSSTISYMVPDNSQVVITVYNSTGEKVKTLANEFTAKGINNIVWDGKDNKGRNVSDGVYYIEIDSGSNSDVKSVVITR
jgi:hypothetical protein